MVIPSKASAYMWVQANALEPNLPTAVVVSFCCWTVDSRLLQEMGKQHEDEG
jgi:hypothetical protein